MKDNEKALPGALRSKKPYRQPELQVYGDLRDITQMLNGSSKPLDQPTKMAMDKTH
jgi:hypothetical protein